MWFSIIFLLLQVATTEIIAVRLGPVVENVSGTLDICCSIAREAAGDATLSTVSSVNTAKLEFIRLSYVKII